MADVQHRVYTEDVFDGTSGTKVDEKKLHALGIEVDSVFVPFLTKEDGYIQRQVAAAKAAQESQPQPSGSAANPSTSDATSTPATTEG